MKEHSDAKAIAISPNLALLRDEWEPTTRANAVRCASVMPFPSIWKVTRLCVDSSRSSTTGAHASPSLLSTACDDDM